MYESTSTRTVVPMFGYLFECVNLMGWIIPTPLPLVVR